VKFRKTIISAGIVLIAIMTAVGTAQISVEENIPNLAKSANLSPLSYSGKIRAGGKLYITDQDNHLTRLYDPIRDGLTTLDIDSLDITKSTETDLPFTGEIKKYPAMEISPQSKALELSIKLPSGMKFNYPTPFNIEMTSNRPEVINPKRLNITKGSAKLKLPIIVNPGEVVLIIDLNFSYCSSTNASLCYFKDARLEIPVRVIKNNGNNFSVKYEVFE